MDLLLRTAGMSAGMARAEAEALLALAGGRVTGAPAPGLLAATAPDAGRAEPVLRRLAFTHEVSVAVTPPEGVPASGIALEGAAFDRARATARPSARTFACRFEGLSADGAPRERGAARLEPTVGAQVEGLEADLASPDLVLRGYLSGGATWLGVEWVAVEGGSFEARCIRHRAFFSPVSLHPRIARCLVNLTAAPPGGRLADPFCGTGGILLEAGLMGLLPSGSDLDAGMVEGTRATLAPFGLSCERLAACDAAEAPERLGRGRFDGVATDLPYGRSATTAREGAAPLRTRALAPLSALLRPGGRLVAGVSERMPAPAPSTGLRELGVFPLRVHRSLTRHFHLYERIGS